MTPPLGAPTDGPLPSPEGGRKRAGASARGGLRAWAFFLSPRGARGRRRRAGTTFGNGGDGGGCVPARPAVKEKNAQALSPPLALAPGACACPPRTRQHPFVSAIIAPPLVAAAVCAAYVPQNRKPPTMVENRPKLIHTESGEPFARKTRPAPRTTGT